MVVVLLLLVLLPVAGVVLALVVPGRGATEARTAWRVAGLLAGVVLAVVVDQVTELGRGTMLAIPVVTLGLLAGVLVGETRRTAPPAGTRQASLQVRRVIDHLPRTLTVAVAAGLVALLGLLAAGVALGSPDDLGRAGRALAVACSDGLSQRRGPWAGSFYAVPLAAVLLGGLVATTLAARAVVRRPLRGLDGTEVGRADEARTRSVTDVVAAYGVLVAVPLAGVAATSAIALGGIECRPAAWTALLWACLALVPLALVLLGLSAAAALRSRRTDAPVRSEGSTAVGR